MKHRCILLLGLLLVSLWTTMAFAQVDGNLTFDASNSTSRKAFEYHVKNESGLYVKSNISEVEEVRGSYRMYAYDKHNEVLYVVNEVGNFAITLSREQVRLMKRNKDVPRLSGANLEDAISKATLESRMQMAKRNEVRENELREERRRAEMARRQREAEERRKEELRQEQERLEQERREKEREAQRKKDYFNSHNANFIPTNGAKLSCSYDDCGIETEEDSVFLISLDGNFIYYLTSEPFQIGETISKLHGAPIPSEMSNSNAFKFHCEVFKDSIPREEITQEFVEKFNSLQYEMGVEKVKNAAPHGYFLNWDWDQNPNLTFRCNFFNLAPRTIKEMVIHWQLTDDDEEVLKTGVFRAAGLNVKPYLWRAMKWSHSSFTVPEEATNMYLTKVMIRYTNNETEVLGEDDIFTNEENEVLPGQPTDGEEYEYDQAEVGYKRPQAPSVVSPKKKIMRVTPGQPIRRVKRNNSRSDVFN